MGAGKKGRAHGDAERDNSILNEAEVIGQMLAASIDLHDRAHTTSSTLTRDTGTGLTRMGEWEQKQKERATSLLLQSQRGFDAAADHSDTLPGNPRWRKPRASTVNGRRIRKSSEVLLNEAYGDNKNGVQLPCLINDSVDPSLQQTLGSSPRDGGKGKPSERRVTWMGGGIGADSTDSATRNRLSAKAGHAPGVSVARKPVRPDQPQAKRSSGYRPDVRGAQTPRGLNSYSASRCNGPVDNRGESVAPLDASSASHGHRRSGLGMSRTLGTSDGQHSEVGLRAQRGNNDTHISGFGSDGRPRGRHSGVVNRNSDVLEAEPASTGGEMRGHVGSNNDNGAVSKNGGRRDQHNGGDRCIASSSDSSNQQDGISQTENGGAREGGGNDATSSQLYPIGDAGVVSDDKAARTCNQPRALDDDTLGGLDSSFLKVLDSGVRAGVQYSVDPHHNAKGNSRNAKGYFAHGQNSSKDRLSGEKRIFASGKDRFFADTFGGKSDSAIKRQGARESGGKKQCSTDSADHADQSACGSSQERAAAGGDLAPKSDNDDDDTCRGASHTSGSHSTPGATDRRQQRVRRLCFRSC